MVVMTMKAKIKWVLLGVLTAVSLVILASVLFWGAKGEQWAVVADVPYRLAAGDGQERIAFLEQFGWVVDEEPVEVEEVVIPTEFSEVYENYNALQLEQGLDLKKYAGKTCKRWVYQVTNYPRDDQQVLATLLIYDGNVIAGDISSANLDGFMAGFLGEHGLMQQPETETAASDADGPSQSADAAESAADAAVIPFDAYPTD